MILVIGYFGYITNQIDGQTIKTREVYSLINNKSMDEVDYCDTQALRSKPLSIFPFLWKIRKADIIVYLPGQNNLTYLFDLIYLFSGKHTKFIYPVVGGWLSDFLEGKTQLIRRLKKFALIGVETKSLKSKLINKYGFTNVDILTNFRIHEYFPTIIRKPESDSNLNLVFMARVSRAKGVDTIFDVAELLDANSIKDVTITFYGKIEPEYEPIFYSRLAKLHKICRYGSLVQPNEVYKTLNQYDLLLLPTFYEGEGFPGSIVDSYKSGIPVIVSRWKDLPEFVEEDKTGFIVEPQNPAQIYKIILTLKCNSQRLYELKRNAYAKSNEFGAESAWNTLKKYL